MRPRVLERIFRFVRTHHFRSRKSLGQIGCRVPESTAIIQYPPWLEIPWQHREQILHPAGKEKAPVLAGKADALVQHLLVFGTQIEQRLAHSVISSSRA